MFQRVLLSAIAIACLATALPLHSAESAPAGERLTVSQTQPGDPDDALKRWFAEQDRLLDDMLARLARIENLVREIHRLIQALPDRAAPISTPPPQLAGAPPSTKPAGVLGFFDEWGTELAALGLLLLVVLISRRHRKSVASRPPAETPVSSLEPKPEPVAVPPAPTFAPVPTVSTHQSAESEQAIELAEIMLSMGLGHGAAQTLTEQIRSEPKQALRHWLKLLEIYRKNGQQEEFERSAEELRQHFNVQPEDWHSSAESHHSLEDYPHIAARLVEFWGKPGCLAYLENLLADNRGGARSGFPQSVAEELLLLSGMIKGGDIPG